MRLLPRALVTLSTLPALLVAPTVSLPAAEARPVAPEIQTLKPVGVQEGALADLQEAAPPASPETTPARKGDLDAEELGHSTDEVRAAAAAAPQPALLTDPVATDEFSLVGVTWDPESVQSDDVSVLVRVREAGDWSEWQALPATDDGPDAGTEEMRQSRPGTSPLLTAAADGVQVRVDTPSGDAPAGLSVSLVDPGTSPADDSLDASAPLASANAAAPRIITRVEWGADESRAESTGRSDTLKAMFVHHTVTTNNYGGVSGAAAQIRSIYAFHTGSRGWSDIGYNFIVDKAGNIFEGRRGSIDELVVGAHTGGFNVDTMGVSALGDFDVNAAPAAMVNSIARVVAWKLGPYGVNLTGRVTLTSAGGGTSKYPAGERVSKDVVSGHRDVGSTACPGRYLYAQLGSIRSKAKALAPQYALSMTGESVSDAAPDYGVGSVELSARLNASVPWEITVTAMCDRDATWSRSGMGTRISASWDLRTNAGGWAVPGVYRVGYTAGNTAWFRDIEVMPRVYGPTSACSTGRISGVDRHSTSVAEGRVAFPTGSAVVIVSGAQANLVDGLVASPLAFAKKAPVLVVAPHSVPAVVADDILRREATTAWIVGGTGAVSPQVETQLRELGITSIRRLAGVDRFQTAAKVALEIKAPAGAAVIASGRSLVDAVTVGGPAARLNRPVLLVEKRSVPAFTASAIRTLGITSATVVGGEGVIGEGARQSLDIRSAPRVAGSDRFGTAAAVARAFEPLVGSSTILVASGRDSNIVDALAGGALGRIMVLTNPYDVPAATVTELSRLSPSQAHVLGGPGAVSTATLRTAHVAAMS